METGEKYCCGHVVAESETADKIGSGGLPVYSTPSMIALMEKTSYVFARNHGLDTVGTKISISHLRACLAGTELRSSAEIETVDGRRLVFRVEVSDGKGIIGEGVHERFVIDPERFMSKLADPEKQRP